MTSFNFATWNVGTNSDYIAMEGSFQQHLEEKAPTQEGKRTWQVLRGGLEFTSNDDYATHMSAVNTFRIQRVTQIIQALARDVPIFSLQEVEREWNLSEILPDGFDFVKKGDEVIAWDTSIFRRADIDVENSIREEAWREKQLWSAPLATQIVLQKDGKKLLVCSAHFTGCDPDTPSSEDARAGDQEVEVVSDECVRFSKQHNIDHIIIGMDANVSRKYSQRLKALEDRVFKIDTMQFPTNINLRKYDALKHRPLQTPTDAAEKKLDYIAVYGGDIAPLPDEFFDQEDKVVPLGNLQKNPSDHVVLIQRINLQKPQGFLAKLFSFFR